MALVALALTPGQARGRLWAGRTAATLLGSAFDRIRSLLRSDPLAAITAWLRLLPKPARERSVV